MKVEVLHKLEDEQILTLQAALKDLNFFTSGEDLYFCYQSNMQELLGSVVGFAKQYLDAGSMSDDNMSDASFQFSRLTLNLLGMFRSFLDHGSAALSRRFGKDSEALRLWEAAQNAEYDQSIAYRFFSNLRNYAQHVGMPPIHFSLGDRVDDESISINLEFHRDELLSTYNKWSKHAKQDLEMGPEKLSMLKLLQEWSNCFHRLVRVIQTIRSDAVICSAHQIVELRETMSVDQRGVLVLMPEPQLSEAGHLTLGYRYIPENKAREIVDGIFLRSFEEY